MARAFLAATCILVLAATPAGAEQMRGRFRNFGYEGQLAAGARFDSNVDHLGFDLQPDMAATANPRLSLAYRRPRMTLRSDASYGWQHYFGLPTDAAAYDRHSLELLQGAQFAFSTGLRLLGEYLFVRSDDAVYNEIDGGSASVVGRYRHQGRMLVGQSFGGSRSDTEAEYVFYKEGYRTARMQVLDRYTHGARVRSRYQLRPRTTLFGDAGAIGNVPVDKAAYPYSDKSINTTIRAGVRAQWTQKIKFSLIGGLSVWIFDISTRATPIVLADLEYYPTALARVTFNYEFGTRDSITSTYFDLNRFVLAFDRRLSRSWDGSTAVEYNWIQFGPPFPRIDHLLKVRGGLTCNPVWLPSLAVGAHYTFERRYAPEIYTDLLRGRPVSLEGRNHATELDVTWSF